MEEYTEINEWLEDHKKNENYEKGQQVLNEMWNPMIKFMDLFGVEVGIFVKNTPSDLTFK